MYKGNVSNGGFVVFWGIIAVFAAFCADQFSKFFVDTKAVIDHSIAVCDYFNLVKVWNTGVSFSMFDGHGAAGTIVLCAVSLIIAAVLFNWMRKETDLLKIISLGMIIGGALGNVADRIRFGAVLDFLDFHIGAYHWPAFNLADTFICVGAFILILLELFAKRKKGLYGI